METSRAHSSNDKLIVALDLSDRVSALEMAKRLQSICRWVKVGLELYLAAGQGVVEELRAMGFFVFLDLKLHDIPNTVAGAVSSVASSGASLLTLHATGGPAMLEAAVAAAARTADGPRLLAVTVLTSMDAAQLAATGITTPVQERVLQLGAMAMRSGVAGLVCSPLEIQSLRTSLTQEEPLLVVPGIRSASDAMGDQSRTASAGDAIRSGASMLVVGRPITTAADPARAAVRILNEIAAAENSLG